MVFALGSAQACREEKVKMKNEGPAPSVSHDQEVLRSLLNLPGAPLEASFEQLPLVPGVGKSGRRRSR
jgi:hypothetical protein